MLHCGRAVPHQAFKRVEQHAADQGRLWRRVRRAKVQPKLAVALGHSLHCRARGSRLDGVTPLEIVAVQSRKRDKGMANDGLVVRPLENEAGPKRGVGEAREAAGGFRAVKMQQLAVGLAARDFERQIVDANLQTRLGLLQLALLGALGLGRRRRIALAAAASARAVPAAGLTLVALDAALSGTRLAQIRSGTGWPWRLGGPVATVGQ